MSGTINLGGILNPANVQPVQQPAPVNPIQMAQQGLQLQSQLYQNQLSGQTLTARNAIGQAYQQAADRKTGVVDYGKLQSLIEQDPRTAYLAPQVMQGIQKQEGRQFNLNKQGLEQTTARTNVANSAFIPLLRLGPNVTTSDVYGAVAGLHAAGVPTDEIVGDMQATMPVMDPSKANDPTYRAAYGQQLQGWVANHAGRALSPDGAARIFSPNVTMVDAGGTIQPTDINPYTNPGLARTTINKTLTPEGQAAPMPGPVGPNGQSTTIPRATFATGQGLGNLVPGGSPFGSGRPGGVPPALLNPNRPAPAAGAGGQPGADPSPFGAAGGDAGSGGAPAPMVTGLGPGQEAGLRVAGDASAKQWADLQAQVGGTAAGGGSAGRIYQLQTALGDLQQLGQTGSGPSAQTINTVKSYLASLPLLGKVLPGLDPTSIANYDQANKYLTAYAAARAGAHGGTTDSQLATTLSSNASTHISNLAAQQVVQANIGLERMDQAQAAAFAQSGKSPDQFSTFSAQWNASQDPRAYVADQLPPQKVVALVNSMSPAERTKFQNTYTTGVRNGWITPPAWAQPAAPAAGAAPSPGGAPPAAPPGGMTPGGY